MILDVETRIPYTQAIVDFLKEKQGEMITLWHIAKALGVGRSSVREDITRLVALGRVRKTGVHSMVQYYIPTDAMLEAERQCMKSNFQPLKPRPEHSAIIERIRSERSAIKSVY